MLLDIQLLDNKRLVNFIIPFLKCFLLNRIIFFIDFYPKLKFEKVFDIFLINTLIMRFLLLEKCYSSIISFKYDIFYNM